jgi:quinol-cytochrome oxidoreductase complex cytochrome b subunit
MSKLLSGKAPLATPAPPAPPPRRKLAAWMRERLPVDVDKLKTATNEPVPGHLKRWFFALGGTPAYLFLIQVATGVLLMFFYVPEPGKAYDSVAHVQNAVPFGWWLRSIHKWSASGMIIAVCLHTMRVFFTGAYRKPRELTWVVGCFLMFVTLLGGLSGYSLVYEQLSYWGATVTSNLVGAAPVVGHFLANFLRGGETVGPATLTRFFVVHVAIVPAAIAFLVFLHVVLIRLHGVTELRFKGDDKEPRTFPFIPDHLMMELSIALILMIGLNVLAVCFPAGLGERANPAMTPEHIRPEWYFYFAFRWLKLTSLKVGVLGTFVAAGVMVCWPGVDNLLRRISPKRDLSIVFGIAAVLVVVVLTTWEALA